MKSSSQRVPMLTRSPQGMRGVFCNCTIPWNDTEPPETVFWKSSHNPKHIRATEGVGRGKFPLLPLLSRQSHSPTPHPSHFTYILLNCEAPLYMDRFTAFINRERKHSFLSLTREPGQTLTHGHCFEGKCSDAC